MDLKDWLSEKCSRTEIHEKPAADLEPHIWTEIRLFLSSTFVDTHAERDVIIKRVIPSVNRKLADRFIRVTPVDLRWGVLAEESKDCAAIQKTCLNQLDKCRPNPEESPWFLGLRTDRYGWVQDKVMASEGFEQPEHYEWIDLFKEYNKNVSITSLECIHATVPPKARKKEPTIFFYKRIIKNPEEMEKELKWVFDFEAVQPDTVLEEDVKYQYVRTEKATVFKDDKDSLDAYLENLDHVKYSTYPCRYEKDGRTRFTCKNENRKSFGVGYVSDLKEFEEMIEQDLMKAIDRNFCETDVSGFLDHQLKNIQHENAVRQKASTFVGRSELYQSCLDHCTSPDVENSVMIIHGEPGCGKSALLAAVSKQCLDDLRKEGDFVFVHAVDTCPGSNNLEGMLRNLQVNLRHYRRDAGDEKISEACQKNVADLKSEHVLFMEDTARSHPDKKFVIFVDAVNQFHESLQAWRMWWLPSSNAPKNLRFIISTLNVENGTFQNACDMAPQAVKIDVKEMSYDDREEMVTAVLKRYNKKLTTTDDSFLGNQMNMLLTKSDSPLYLIAATEALRKFGIFERVSQYIETLPNTIKELFSFLLVEWSDEYGEQFTRDVMGLLCVSPDGLLENEINDILSFKETEDGMMYDCSFSRLYDSLCSFLAAGGGGFLRFFHDQLKYEVKAKFLTPEIEKSLHVWLIKFYLSCIQPQLVEKPTVPPPAYYDHCLSKLVHHQIQLKGTDGPDDTHSFVHSLRNIYFVRERINNDQEELLQQEYVNVVRSCTDDKQRNALKEWAKFTQLYSPFIKKFPSCAYNMAVNQVPTSAVCRDTTGLHEAPEVGEGYPLYWSNISPDEDPLALKYTTTSATCCAATSPDKNLCCFGTDWKAVLCEMDSGVLVQQVETKGYISSVYISSKKETFWSGDSKRIVTVWSRDSGMEEWSTVIEGGGSIIWMAQVNDFVACGTGKKYGTADGHITIFDEEQREAVNSWSTGLHTHSYCFDVKQSIILSTHHAKICSWSLSGELMQSIEYGTDFIVSVACSPHHNTIAFVTMNTINYNVTKYECDIIQMVYDTQQYVSTIDTKTTDIVLYNDAGDQLLCNGELCKTIMVYNTNGTLENKMKAHSFVISDMCMVPGSGDLLSAAGDGSFLFNIPTSPDKNVGKESEEGGLIGWCDFLPGGDNFASLNEDGKFEVWDTESLQPQRSAIIEGGRWTAVHPTAHYVAVYTYDQIYWLNTITMETVAVVTVLEDSSDVWIWDIHISGDGATCLVATYQHGGVVYDIEDITNTKKRLTYIMEGDYMQTAHIHSDNVRAVTGGSYCADLWNMETGDRLKTLRYGQTNYVLFLPDPDRVLYADAWGRVSIMDFDGNEVISLNSVVNDPPAMAMLNNGRELMTGELHEKTISVHDVVTGDVVYAFVEHRSTLFNCLAVHPSNSVILAYNQNGLFYILKNTRH